MILYKDVEKIYDLGNHASVTAVSGINLGDSPG